MSQSLRGITLSALLLSASVLLLSSPAASAQSTSPTILEAGPWPEVRVAVEPEWTTVPVPWMVQFGNVVGANAAPADGQARIEWALACGEHELRLENATTPIPSEPGQGGKRSGVAGLSVQAAAGTRGMEPLECLLTAAFRETSGSYGADAEVPVQPVVDQVGGIAASVPFPVKQAGPQKQVPFEIEVRNDGNSQVSVAFEVVERPRGKWNALPPEVLFLGPGGTNTAIFTVATPFHQGFVNMAGNYTVRLTPSAGPGGEPAGEPVDVGVRVTAKGWYVPGPSPLLAVAVLAALALAVRARAGQRP